jgi:hypothetical protein
LAALAATPWRWALFTDTVDGMTARLLVDERATHIEVSQAIR